MGFNVNMDIHKMPHIWQTFIAMAFGGIFIASAAIGITAKLTKDNVKRLETEKNITTSIKSFENTVDEVVSSQKEILDLITLQNVKIDNYNNNLENEVAKIRSTFMFYVNNVEKMTREQMESILSDVYGMGYNDGKKKGQIP